MRKSALTAFLSARDRFPRHPDRSTRYADWRPGRSPLADVYLPPATPPSGTSVLLVHGGAFVVGSRTMPAILSLATRLVEDGVAVVTFDYRTLLCGGRWREAASDTRAALRWWHREAPSHGCDPGRIAVLGLSAGASLALNAIETEADVPWWGGIGVYGVYDFTAPPPWAGATGMSVLHQSRDRSLWRQRSLCHTSSSSVPHLLLHGEDDGLVPVEHSASLAKRRRDQGLPIEFVTYPGESHAFLADPTLPVWTDAYSRILSFLRRED